MQLNERDCQRPLIARFVRIFRERETAEIRVVEESWVKPTRIELKMEVVVGETSAWTSVVGLSQNFEP